MRVLVAGATGVIGRRLVPQLIAAGHAVTGITRSAARADELRAAGAEPVVCDALDRDAVREAVVSAAPDAIVHQLTSLPARIRPRRIERDFAANDRLRVDGTRNLVSAARAAGTRRIVAQSITFAYAPGPPGAVHVETDPLYLDAPKAYRRTVGAVAALEESVLGAGGTVLRYGYFYGPGSSLARDGSLAEDARKRLLPVVGGGAGVWSLIHVDDAAAATVAALGHDGPAIFNIVDDAPAPVSEWLPGFAAAVGAPRPPRVPAWLARLAAGGYAVETMTRAQGATNARARDELAWEPRYPSWREGFATL